MKTIYIAGPFSAPTQIEREQNRLYAINIAAAVRKAGYAAICPHVESYLNEDALDEEGWIKHGLQLLSICDECYVIGDYQKSSGTMREIGFSEDHDIPLRRAFFALDGLVVGDFQLWRNCQKR